MESDRKAIYMNTYDVVVLLSKNTLDKQERKIIEEYLNSGAEWDILFGQLMFHKLLCRAYSHFFSYGWLNFVPSAIRRPFKKYFELNNYKNSIKKPYFTNLVESLNKENVRYCIIKGLPLENELFGDSVREFNDTDLLINFSDYTLVDRILRALGYKRGVYNTENNSVEVNRRLDIYNTLNTHQTLPYRKKINDQFFRIDVVDLQFEFTLQKKFNFKVDTNSILNNRISVDVDNQKYCTLNTFDNFLMLCTHLYGEAILIQEIAKYKDLQLTKFADIYEWIEKHYKHYDWNEKNSYIIACGLLQPVLYCVYIVSKLYNSDAAKDILVKFGNQDLSFIDEYRDELFNVKRWSVPVVDRIFRVDKNKML